MSNNVLPPEVVDNVLQIVTYFFAAAVGWFAKWLKGKNKKGENV